MAKIIIQSEITTPRQDEDDNKMTTNYNFTVYLQLLRGSSYI